MEELSKTVSLANPIKAFFEQQGWFKLIQFDAQPTFEHPNGKPLNVPLAVMDE
ncbi:MAG: hypothetical protein AB8B79_11445 [Granulosicoccus sp.]